MEKKTDDEETKDFGDKASRLSEHYEEYLVLAKIGELFLWKSSSHQFAVRAAVSVMNSVAETMLAKDAALTEKYEALKEQEKQDDGLED